MAKIEVKSEITGTVWQIKSKPGDKVESGDTLIVIESMKMEIPVITEDGGTVKLTLVDGFVESVDVSAVPAAVRERVRAVTDTLIGRRRVNLADIERKLLIAGDTPGMYLRSTLVAGRQDGGTVLVLDGGFRPVTGTVVLDNRLSAALGRWPKACQPSAARAATMSSTVSPTKRASTLARNSA